MSRRHTTVREQDPESGQLVVALYDESHARKVLSSHHRMMLRTKTALRDLVLFCQPNDVVGKSEIADFPRGKVDPAIQLILHARDQAIREDVQDSVRLGYLREARSLLDSTNDRVDRAMLAMAAAMEKQRDRELTHAHHLDKMEALKEKGQKDKSGQTIRDLMDRALDGEIRQRVDEQLDRLAPIVVTDLPEDEGETPEDG